MESQTRLSVVAGLYHEWDKSFRNWVVEEVSHWCISESLKNKLWSVNAGMLFDLFSGLGWDVRNKPYFKVLDACRLVVNVFKHGNGQSLHQLKDSYPEYLCSDYNFEFMKSYTTFSDLIVTDQHLTEFSRVINAFWLDVPENILSSDKLSLPAWFEKAAEKDNSSLLSR